MTHQNAMRLFHYDPFSIIPKEQATVGALRAQAADVDVSEKSSGRSLIVRDEPVRIVDLAERGRRPRSPPDPVPVTLS